ncbi:MAG: molybdopterin-binding protein [Oscillospiraceae bacterium]
MKKIRVQDAVGQVLCHDMTRIIVGESKDAQFRKGHVIREEDIAMLLSMGKEHIYVLELGEGIVHENDAAEQLCLLCHNAYMCRSAVKEGKIELSADCDGLFRVDTARLNAINLLEDMMIATRHGETAVRAGDKLAGMRVIPLTIAQEKLDKATKIGNGIPILELIPYRLRRAGIITTGSEIFHGRIKDTFTPVVVKKLAHYGIAVELHVVVDDGMQNIASAISEMRTASLDMIVCTGGMSVDPDDNTPGAIRISGAQIVSYGAPVLPGAMFLLGYFEDGMPIMGLPGCVMYAAATIFDLVLPRVAAGVRLTKSDLVAYGNGGLCLGCKPCRYPVCPFGK